MSESVIFELKLQIQHLQEKLTFLAGGTNGAELVEVLMEKDEELEKNTEKLKEMEGRMFQLADGAKRVDAKRRELLRHSEHQSVRLQALERELDRQLGQSDDLRRQVADTEGDLAMKQEELQKTQADMASAETTARETLASACAEASSLQRIVESQREKISGLEGEKSGLQGEVAKKGDDLKNMEQRKKDASQRAREMKLRLEGMLSDSQKSFAHVSAERDSLDADTRRLRRRLDERAKAALEEERKTSALARECGTVKTELEAARQDIASASEELKAVRASKQEADETLLAKDKENTKLRAKNDALRQEIDRRVHRANQEKTVLGERMEESRRMHEEREATLHEQMRRMESDSSDMADTLMGKISSLEKLLATAEGDGERLRAEACTMKEETAVKARKFEANSKAEGRWRARAEEAIAGSEAEATQLRTEVATARHQVVELHHLEAANKELKGRIERQEAYHKRKMEKEKRARSGTRAAVIGSITGRAPIKLQPLPPVMNDRGGVSDDIDNTNSSERNNNNNNNNNEDDGSSDRARPRAAAAPPSSSSSSSCGTRRVSSEGDDGRAGRVPAPLSSGKDGDVSGGGGGGGGRGGNLRSISPFRRPSSVPPRDRHHLFSTPESERSADKENDVRTRRAPAWEPGSGGGGGGGCNSGGAGADKRGARDIGDFARGGRVGGGESVNRVTEKSVSSAGKIGGCAGAARPLGSRTIRSVSRSISLKAHDSARHPSRGRSAVAAKTITPRSSSVGLQSRAAGGWR